MEDKQEIPRYMRPMVNDVYMSTDSEFFLRDEDGNIVSSDEVLPKQEEAWSEGGRYKANMYTDGVQGEFNFKKKTCRHHIVKNMRKLKSLLKNKIPKDLEVIWEPSVELPPEDVQFLSPFARRLGCDPSRGAWIDGEEMDNPAGEESPTRYAGSHLHMGHKKFSPEDNVSPPLDTRILKDHEFVKKMVKVCDYVLALPMVQLFGSEAGSIRRNAYGKAGTYRKKPYGLEYRVLGPKWAQYMQLIGPVFGYFREAFSIAYSGETEDVLSLVPEEKVIDAINNDDRLEAAKLYNKIKPYLMNRNGENHTGGMYLRAFDMLCALGMDEVGDAYDNDHGNVNWGRWCANYFLPKYRDMMESHEHGKIYLEPDDFKIKVPMS